MEQMFLRVVSDANPSRELSPLLRFPWISCKLKVSVGRPCFDNVPWRSNQMSLWEVRTRKPELVSLTVSYFPVATCSLCLRNVPRSTVFVLAICSCVSRSPSHAPITCLSGLRMRALSQVWPSGLKSPITRHFQGLAQCLNSPKGWMLPMSENKSDTQRL